MSLKKAWHILDLNCGDLGGIITKLKETLMAIKLKATNNTARDVELFNEVQFIAVKLKMSSSVVYLRRGGGRDR